MVGGRERPRHGRLDWCSGIGAAAGTGADLVAVALLDDEAQRLGARFDLSRGHLRRAENDKHGPHSSSVRFRLAPSLAAAYNARRASQLESK
jgi:hypothetical protein